MTQQLSRNHLYKILYCIMLAGAFFIACETIPGYDINSAVGILLMGAVIILACIPWWHRKKIQCIEAQIQCAKADLLQQKHAFIKQKKARAAEMQKLQLEEMLYMYRFAELGQLGAILLHDLANHLTTLSLAVDDLRDNQDSKVINRIREILGHIEDIVESTQERLHGETKERSFNMAQKIDETITFLSVKAAKAHVIIEWRQPAGEWRYKGDVNSLCQAVAIIVSNAIDAYGAPAPAAALAPVQRVAVSMQRDDKNITICIDDWGKGIPKHAQRDLFKPVHSTKKSGLGLGLYIARLVIEMQFMGTISLNAHSQHTQFVIKIPTGAKLEV